MGEFGRICWLKNLERLFFYDLEFQFGFFSPARDHFYVILCEESALQLGYIPRQTETSFTSWQRVDDALESTELEGERIQPEAQKWG